jgi:hypothetical protein
MIATFNIYFLHSNIEIIALTKVTESKIIVGNPFNYTISLS